MRKERVLLCKMVLCIICIVRGCGYAKEGVASAALASDNNRCNNYSLRVGTLVITALCDGYLDLDLNTFIIPQEGASQFALEEYSKNSSIKIPINVYLINTGSKLVLIDAGLAGLYETPTGLLVDSLRRAGYGLEHIDMILITHLHPDHVGGLLTKEGCRAFPNAVVYVAHSEAAFWLDGEEEAVASDDSRPVFSLARAILKPYRDAGKLVLFCGHDELDGGIKAVSLPGHTPGHTGFLFESCNHTIIFLGDTVHCHDMQCAQPAISSIFDTNQKQAIESRKKIFEYAATNNIIVGNAHIPFPGIGWVQKAENDGCYAWKAVS